MLKWILGAVVLIAVGVFAYWTISPFFRNVKVDEALPGNSQSQGEMAPETPMDEPVPANEELVATEPVAVTGTTGHPASGSARLVTQGDTTYVRYENFKTLNGPDIYVYLAKDLEAKEYINLGRVKATEGNINYEVPTGVDISQYPYVLTWCRAFGVLFNYARLQ